MAKIEPKIYTLDKLPKFIQILVADMWEENGVKESDLNKNDLVFAYFDGIYMARPIPTDLFVHESVHLVRQGDLKNETMAKNWWIRYCEDDQFRYDEEIIAYREQYQFILNKVGGNRPLAFKHAQRLARDLSGPSYGNICSYEKALLEIVKK